VNHTEKIHINHIPFLFAFKTGAENKIKILQTFIGGLENYNIILFIRGSSRPQFSRKRPVCFLKIGSFPGSVHSK